MWRRGAEGRHRFIDAGEGARAELSRDAGDADILTHRIVRLSGLATLRRDDYDAVGCLRSVNRRGGRTLEHLDRLDIRRIEIGDTIRRIVLVTRNALPWRCERQEIRRRLDRRVAHDHTIDDVERCRRADDRRDTAKPNLHAAARSSGVRPDLGAYHLALQRHVETLRRCLDRAGRRSPSPRRSQHCGARRSSPDSSRPLPRGVARRASARRRDCSDRV